MTELKEIEVVPVPRFKIGDTAYVPHTAHVQVNGTCPDCGGTGKWNVTTSTRSFEVECMRCDFARKYGDGSIAVYQVEPRVTECKVRGFQIAPREYGERRGELEVGYFISEMNGRRTEGDLFPTRAEAEAVAKKSADDENARREARDEQKELQKLRYQDVAEAVAHLENKAKKAAQKRFSDLVNVIGELMHASVDGFPSSVSSNSGLYPKILLDSDLLARVSLHLLREAGEDIPDDVKEATGYCDD